MRKKLLLILVLFPAFMNAQFPSMNMKKMAPKRIAKVTEVKKFMPTVIEIQDADGVQLGNVERDYDADGNLILEVYESEDVNYRQEYQWAKLPNGRLVKIYERLEEFDSDRMGEVSLMEAEYDLVLGTLVARSVKYGSGNLDNETSITWREEENWITEKNEKGVRIGIKGLSPYSDMKFDDQDKILKVTYEDEDGIMDSEYTWEGDKIQKLSVMYEDIDSGSSETLEFTTIEIIHNSHLFDPYALVPYLQLEEIDESPSKRIYYNASGIIKVGGISMAGFQMESAVDVSKGFYELGYYITYSGIKYKTYEDIYQKTDSYGSYEWVLNNYEIGSGRNYYQENYIGTYDDQLNLMEYSVEIFYEYMGRYSYAENRIFTYNSENYPTKCEIYAGSTLASAQLEGIEIYKDWKEITLQIDNCSKITKDDIQVWLSNGSLQIETSALIKEISVYSPNGVLYSKGNGVEKQIPVPAGVSIIRIETENGVITQKVMN